MEEVVDVGGSNLLGEATNREAVGPIAAAVLWSDVGAAEAQEASADTGASAGDREVAVGAATAECARSAVHEASIR